ncbi:MAG: DUF2971 domain-containing protein [Candidatus Sericytochromatia bacterium]|nr:DUF2971 domain-containing protein [Candidatus Sericytochromatia bacterium]
MAPETSYLYHFTPFDDGPSRDAVERILLHHELTLTAMPDLADPLDALAFATFDPTEDGLRRIVRDLIEQSQPGLEPARRAMEVAKVLKLGYTGNAELAKAVFDRFTNDVRRQFGVFRFSATADHPLLWQHWAAGQTGICLVFQKGDIFDQAKPVQYQPERPAIPCQAAFTGEEALNTFLTKGPDWAHEQEWRLCRLPGQGGPGGMTYEPGYLFGVILGSAMPTGKRRELQALLARQPFPVNVWRATYEPAGFGLEMVPQT